MGIQGLLPMLKSITTTVHVSMYSGRRVAIDAYGWLHKGAYSCSRQLCEGTPTDKCGLLRNMAVVPPCRLGSHGDLDIIIMSYLK